MNHSSVQGALAALAVSVPRLTIKDPGAAGYVSRFTLRNWIQDHTKLDRALTAAATGQYRDTVRTPPAGSARAVLPSAVQESIGSALESAENQGDFVAKLHESIPEFSQTDPKAANYIPASSLRRWFKGRYFDDQRDLNEPETWDCEFDRSFCITFPKPSKLEIAVAPEDEVEQWLVHGSWVFCPKCGRRRPRSSTQTLKISRAAIKCQPSCDPSAEQLLLPRAASDSELPKKLEAYVMPDSPNWEPLLLELELTGLPLTTNISKKDLDSLAVLDLKVVNTRPAVAATRTSQPDRRKLSFAVAGNSRRSTTWNAPRRPASFSLGCSPTIAPTRSGSTSTSSLRMTTRTRTAPGAR